MDERRRRRLAVKGDGSDSADVGEEKPLPDCVPTELCAAAPWIPRAPWKLWTLSILLYVGLVGVLTLVYRTPSLPPELVPAADALFRGEQPRLVNYLETIFWTLSGQLAMLIGWHRSCSKLDFSGRYRFWPWVAAGFFLAGLCVATELHHGVGAILQPFLSIPHVGPHASWLIPAFCWLLPAWLLMDCDVRRSLASLILLRTSLVIFSCGGASLLYAPPGLDRALLPMIQSICGLVGSATLMLALWVQGWSVAYVTPDPPAATQRRWPKFGFNVFGWLFGLIFGLFRRKAVEAEPAPRRRKKAAESTATKPKRKTKRAAKPRTRKVVEETEPENEETDDEPYDEQAESEETYEDEEEDTSAPVTAPASKSNATYNQQSQTRQNSAPPPKSGNWSAQQQDEDEEDEDSDGTTWRVDGPSPEQLKGLSKRQRRALIKQHRDAQRTGEER